MAGGDPVSATNFSMEAQRAQLHAAQTPDICMPPPCIEYWHPPTDHRPDWNGVASYGPCKPADTSGIFQPESFTHNGQTLVSQGVEVRHGTIYCGYHPETQRFMLC